MDKTTQIHDELKDYGIEVTGLQVLSDKDGITVCRLRTGKETYVLKYFENPVYRREIGYYDLVQQMGLETIPIVGKREASILMEDMADHARYRLAKKEDLNEASVVVALAEYYKHLHRAGRAHLKDKPKVAYYSELKRMTPQALRALKEKTAYDHHDFWQDVNDLIQEVMVYYERHKTITYNDFYHVNMVVSKDLKEAFMFDYNMLGEGLAYGDIRNVLSCLNEEMSALFIKTYGPFSPYEEAIDGVIGDLFSLLVAYERVSFPKWAQASLDKLLSGQLADRIKHIKREGF